ncbi:DUF4158 domain-containing protein [Nonomuraea dietziae]|uniref:DUF4158 domain-containing protein n=1 Tax=Nonomuraea dietziae TaxID=65515 RepID=UPI0033F3E80C
MPAHACGFPLSEHVARGRRFRPEVSVAELEQFFRLDVKALEALAGKRRSATKLGWAVQWATVRMLGTFLAEDLLDVARWSFATGPRRPNEVRSTGRRSWRPERSGRRPRRCGR